MIDGIVMLVAYVTVVALIVAKMVLGRKTARTLRDLERLVDIALKLQEREKDNDPRTP